MTCKCGLAMLRGVVQGVDGYYCLTCGRSKPIETPERQLKIDTPPDVPQVLRRPGEANVVPARCIRAVGQRPNKYGNVRTERDGIDFVSKHEADVYSELCLMQAAGEISCLATQRKYLLAVNDQKICTYIADFVYIQDHEQVVVDAKGVKTPVYKLKKKMMKAILGIDIVEM